MSNRNMRKITNEPSISNRALIIVDVQNDFVSGSLPVPNAIDIIPNINDIIKSNLFKFYIYSKDWHPINHSSFKTNDGLWPEHCVQSSEGAMIHPNLEKYGHIFYVHKGINQKHESFSAFKDEFSNENRSLIKILESHDIQHIYVCGFAFEYCVLNTALDASSFGFKTYILSDCSGYINEESFNGMDALKTAQIELVTKNSILSKKE